MAYPQLLLDSTTSAKIFVGMQLVQGLVCSLFPKSNHKIYGGSDDSLLMQTITTGCGYNLLASGVLGYGLMFQDGWDLSTTIGYAFLVQCINNWYKIISGNATKSGGTVTSQMIPLCMKLFGAFANLTKQEYASIFTKAVAIFACMNGVLFVLKPDKGLKKWSVDAKPSKSALSMIRVLGYLILGQMATLLSASSGVEATKSIAFGAMFPLFQIVDFLFITDEYAQTSSAPRVVFYGQASILAFFITSMLI